MPEAALNANGATPSLPAPSFPRSRRHLNRLYGATPARPVRIVLYSHDTLGLGHTRRNLLIAQTLAGSAQPCSILLICGAIESRSFAVPPGVDYLSLPALTKDTDGRYRARRLGCSLDDLIALRSETIRGAVRAFKPDVFIVDNVPHGAQGELIPALTDLRRHGNTRCVLGLRDILDDPEMIQAEWTRAGAGHLLGSVYDAIWIYGDRTVYDPLEHYPVLAPVASRVRFTGYLDQRARRYAADPKLTSLIEDLDARRKQLALCTVGGGQDGAALAKAFAVSRFPDGIEGLLLTGPHMPPEQVLKLQAIAAARPDLTVLEFVAEPAPLLQRADRVISMGGYNSTCELLSYGKTALVVPRVRPRQEQWLRASRLRDLGAIDVLHPDVLCPEALEAWLTDEAATQRSRPGDIDIDGLTRLPSLLEEVQDREHLSSRQQTGVS